MYLESHQQMSPDSRSSGTPRVSEAGEDQESPGEDLQNRSLKWWARRGRSLRDWQETGSGGGLLCVTDALQGAKGFIYIYIYDREYKILHSVDCQSPWVIYIIECKKCNLQYVGKSETSVNIRLNNHRNHIKTAVNSCELTDHFLQNQRSHSFDRDIAITLIEQIRKRDTMTKDRKKELLCAREIFWQQRLQTIQPGGLNKRMG